MKNALHCSMLKGTSWAEVAMKLSQQLYVTLARYISQSTCHSVSYSLNE